MGKFIDLTDKRFGRLTAIRPVGKTKGNSFNWLCHCDCGNKKEIDGNSLRKNLTKSCGCLHDEVSRKRVLTHGFTKTRPYRIYQNMKARCYNSKNTFYYNYGGRGILVCKEWLESFENFWEDMKQGYADNLTLDRVDNNKGYCKENCKWATRKEQATHTRQTRYLTFKGEIKTITQWAESVGLTRDVFRSRIDKYGWTIEKALTTPKLQ